MLAVFVCEKNNNAGNMHCNVLYYFKQTQPKQAFESGKMIVNKAKQNIKTPKG